MNTELKKKSDFQKDFFKLTNSKFFGKVMESVRKHWDIKTCNSRKKNELLTN